MVDNIKEKAEKTKVVKKLLSKWLLRQETENKATLLLSKNPEIKISRTLRNYRIS
jgi:hypothetical protein